MRSLHSGLKCRSTKIVAYTVVSCITVGVLVWVLDSARQVHMTKTLAEPGSFAVLVWCPVPMEAPIVSHCFFSCAATPLLEPHQVRTCDYCTVV
jgi:hypothetical protein